MDEVVGEISAGSTTADKGLESEEPSGDVPSRDLPVREMHLFEGRRVRVSDLLEAGLLEVEGQLVFERPFINVIYSATVTEHGHLRLADGRAFKTPSRAAIEAAGGNIDGWRAWKLADGRFLDDLRQELLNNDDTVGLGGPPGLDQGASTPSRHARLRSARDQSKEGTNESVAVRDFLGWWGALGRGSSINSMIDADLDNHGLSTVPDYKTVHLDTAVELRFDLDESAVNGESSSGGPRTSANSESPHRDLLVNQDIDVGMTLALLVPQKRPLISVEPDADLRKAITLMRTDSYSQLAVMTGSRDPLGAVTWESICRAQARQTAPIVSDALIAVETRRYDEEVVDVLSRIAHDGFVLVEDFKKAVTGIVTTADVVEAYGEMATPFFLIGELDGLLRRIVEDVFEIEVVIDHCKGSSSKKIQSFSDLGFADYHTLLAGKETWTEVQSNYNLNLDRKVFGKRLNELRLVRNNIAHFGSDPAPAGDIEKLRNFLRLLREDVLG